MIFFTAFLYKNNLKSTNQHKNKKIKKICKKYKILSLDGFQLITSRQTDFAGVTSRFIC